MEGFVEEVKRRVATEGVVGVVMPQQEDRREFVQLMIDADYEVEQDPELLHTYNVFKN